MKTVGVIGFGSIGRVHATNLTDLGYRVIFYDPEYLEAGSVSSIAGSVSSIEEFASQAEAVVISSPSHMHATHAFQCLGKPLFIEKPIWFEEVSGPRSVSMVGYNLRHHQCVTAAEKWLHSPELTGRPLHATAVCAQLNSAPKYKNDGLFRNWSHEIDLVAHFLGKPEILGASLSLDGRAGHIMLEHQTGVFSTVYLDYKSDPQARLTTIACEKATIIINLAQGYAVLLDHNGNHIEKVSVENGFQKSYRDEMIAFMQRIHGFTTRGATLEEAEHVLSICLKANELAGLT